MNNNKGRKKDHVFYPLSFLKKSIYAIKQKRTEAKYKNIRLKIEIVRLDHFYYKKIKVATYFSVGSDKKK